MRCPLCNRPGVKAYGGYCTKVHRDLNRRTEWVVLECATCGAPVRRRSKQVSEGGRVFCPRCPKNQGESHPRWKEGQYVNPAGYRLVLIHGDYKLQHRHTWELANHACLLPEATGNVAIHHINKNKLDNRPENLCLISSKDHGRLHRLMDSGRYDEAKCILIKWLNRQCFFVEHSQHLDRIKQSSLPDILSTT